jgi:hypothetical protein
MIAGLGFYLVTVSATARCGSARRPQTAVPGRLLPLYQLRLCPGVIVTSGLTCAADPSGPSVTFGQVGEPADHLRDQRITSGIGEARLPPAPAPSCASWSDTRFNVTVNSRSARDSLIGRKNSLMARINSLQGRIKLPVPMCRELDRKLLYLALHSEPIAALGGRERE